MKLEKILPIIAHLIFILSGMFIVFWILDKYNPLMGFISGMATRSGASSA